MNYNQLDVLKDICYEHPGLFELWLFYNGLQKVNYDNLPYNILGVMQKLIAVDITESYLFDDISGYNNLLHRFLYGPPIVVNQWSSIDTITYFCEHLSSILSSENGYLKTYVNGLIESTLRFYSPVEYQKYINLALSDLTYGDD